MKAMKRKTLIAIVLSIVPSVSNVVAEQVDIQAVAAQASIERLLTSTSVVYYM